MRRSLNSLSNPNGLIFVVTDNSEIRKKEEKKIHSSETLYKPDQRKLAHHARRKKKPRCELWAKYIFPEKNYSSSSLQIKLHSEHRMLCEKHFKDNDFTDCTKQILVRAAVPCDGTSVLSEENTVTYGSTAALSPSLLQTYCEAEKDGETDATSGNTMTPGDVEACRVCLTTHRLRRMTDRARRAYGLLTGLTPPNDGHLPPYVCVTCAHRVKSFVRFRTDCLRASQLVLDAISKHKQVTQESIKSVAGERRLGSHLSVTHNQTDRYDLQIVHDETQGAPVDYDGLLKPHAIVNVPRAHDEEQDTARDGDQCMPGGDAALYIPTVPNYNTDCDVIAEYLDSDGSLDDETAAGDTSNNIGVAEITINNVTDDGDEEVYVDSKICKRFKSDNAVNNFDRHTKNASVPHEGMAVTNDTMNKSKDKVMTVVTNDSKRRIVYVWVPNVKQIGTNKDAVPGTAKPIGR